MVFTVSAYSHIYPIKTLKYFCCQEHSCFVINLNHKITFSVGWGGCRRHRLLPRPKECPRYDIKQSDGEVPVMLELWGMWNAPSLSLLPGPFWPGVVVPVGINKVK